METGILKLRASLRCGGSVVGYKEREGPLGECFDHCSDREGDADLFGEETFEAAEAQMQHMALECALRKCGVSAASLDALLAGDLQNQCVASAYGLRDYRVPYLGLYGACSTAVEGLLLGAMGVSCGQWRQCAVVTSSHNSSAERQYRTPLSYGGQRTPTAQWTVTGAAALILGAWQPREVSVVGGAVGMVSDRGIRDAANMGAAMAPAAADTLCRYFTATNTSPRDYDGIFTGDLGSEGSAILLDLLRLEGVEPLGEYADCGCMIYDGTRQDTHAGGSGCGCSAVVLASYLLPRLQSGVYRRILLIGTGALMNPDSLKQGRSIPGIAHLIELRAPECRSEQTERRIEE